MWSSISEQGETPVIEGKHCSIRNNMQFSMLHNLWNTIPFLKKMVKNHIPVQYFTIFN